MNPYSNQLYLYVPNAQKAALGQFFRDYGSQLAGFYGGEDANMVGVSTDGLGPPDGWVFASWVTAKQAQAFTDQLPNMPPGTVISSSVGQGDFPAWLSGLGMQRVEE